MAASSAGRDNLPEAGGSFLKATPMTDVTRILSQIEQGDAGAAKQLLPLVYEELRKLAAQKMAHKAPGQTLRATREVNSGYATMGSGSRQGLLGPGFSGFFWRSWLISRSESLKIAS